MPEPQYRDLIFPQQQAAPLSELLGSLRRSNLSIHNRLASIRSDAQFVRRAVAALGGRPLVANERCGSWYMDPRDKSASAYFKSTDGHERAWKFSTRRLNLHLVDLVEQNDGIIIVDSTRRGKRMPDALSATIPIWCAVLNRVLLPSHPLSSKLFLPPYYPPTTHAQISALIPSFVSSLRELDLPLPTSLSKPLRPFWVTQDTSLADGDDAPGDPRPLPIFEDYRPVVCCTASSRVVATTEAEGGGGYIQGAADDTENWAHGLTPSVFWAHADQLLAAEEDRLPGLIGSLLEEEEQQQQQHHRTGDIADSATVRLTSRIAVRPLPLDGNPPPDDECRIVLGPRPTAAEDWERSPRLMEAGLGRSKAASRNLRLALPRICSFAASFLGAHPGGRVLVACESGRDLSVGVALCLSCYLFDGEGGFRVPDGDVGFTKTLVKTRLGAIMTAFPGGNPSRNTLQSVNSFLMDWRT